MPIYTGKCLICGGQKQVVCSSSDIVYEECCGQTMVRDYQADLPHAHADSYRRAIVSDSLAMNPCQIPEHNKLFPDIEVLPDGRPMFDNFKKHDAYLKKTGFVKVSGKARKGKKVTP